MTTDFAPRSRAFHFALLFLLAMAQTVPVALLDLTLPVVLHRGGVAMADLSIISIVMFPWALKALWAPLVDWLGARSRLGRYRGWLFLTHPLLFLTLVAGSFVDIPTLLTTHRAVGIPALLWLTVVCSTADTAAHGLAVNLLPASERGVGNGVQVAGMMIGSLMGGGLTVVLVSWLGWRIPLLLLAMVIALPIAMVLYFRERPVDSTLKIRPREVFAFFKKPRIFRWLAVIAGMSFATNLMYLPLQTLLVDRGFNLVEIGLTMGCIASVSGIVGGALGGFVVTYLGRLRSFYVLNLCCCLCMSMGLFAQSAVSRPALYVLLALPYLGMIMCAPVVYTLIMDRSRGHTAGTDYTIQFSASQLCGFFSGGLGAMIAGRFGKSAPFLITPALMLLMIGIAFLLLNKKDFQPDADDASLNPENPGGDDVRARA